MRAQITAVALAAIATIAACGDNSDSAKSFCEQFGRVEAELAQLDQTTPDDLNDLNDLIDRFDDIDPPTEIQDAYDDLIATYKTIAAGDSALTDPAIASQLSEAQTHLTKIETFLTQEC